MRNDMDLYAISLFAGAGGLDLAAKKSGVRTVAYVEWDKDAQELLIDRMQDGGLDEAPLWDDVSTFDGLQWRGKVDIVFGGFPCQDVSVAGKKQGIGGSRSGLWGQFARIVGEVGPSFVLVENVAGLLMGGASELSSQTWPRWGLMLGGELFLLESAALHISVNESELLPTPEASLGLIPFESWESARRKLKGESRKSGAKIGSSLKWDLGVIYLRHNFKEFRAVVNPRFCEWMMGWPKGWTILKRNSKEPGTE